MGGLFGGPKIGEPDIRAPARIADEEMLKKKRKENIAKQTSRSGRKSTILSDKEGMG